MKILREKTEKFIACSVPVSTEKQENGKNIKNEKIFNDSVRLMASSLSNLTDNLAEGLHEGKCNCKSSRLEFMTANNSLLTFKCMVCNKTYERNFDQDLSKGF